MARYSAASARTLGWGLCRAGSPEAQPAAARTSPSTRPGASHAGPADRADLAGDIRQPLRYAPGQEHASPDNGVQQNRAGPRLNYAGAGYVLQNIGATCQATGDRREQEMAGASGTGCRSADSGWMQQFR